MAPALRGTTAQFCSDKCRMTWNGRRQTRGAQLYDAAMKMRDKRERGGVTDLCQIIDRFLQKDREAGRITYNNESTYWRE